MDVSWKQVVRMNGSDEMWHERMNALDGVCHGLVTWHGMQGMCMRPYSTKLMIDSLHAPEDS
jgi:hypothetical protein